MSSSQAAAAEDDFSRGKYFSRKSLPETFSLSLSLKSKFCIFFQSEHIVFLKWAIPYLFFIYFSLFKQILQIMKKCPSSIRCWDLNPRPLEHESPPITTRPRLPPQTSFVKFNHYFSNTKIFLSTTEIELWEILHFGAPYLDYPNIHPWSSLVEGDEGSYLPKW